MVGIPARPMLVDVTAYQRDFMPYGTPCSDCFDPEKHKIEQLQAEVEQLQRRLAALLAEREQMPTQPELARLQERGRA